MKENTMSITRAQLREMILKEATDVWDKRDKSSFADMDWSDAVAPSAVPATSDGNTKADEDSLYDAFKELTDVRPANIGLIVKIWNKDNLGKNVKMYDWLLALPDREDVSMYAADLNALQRALDNRKAAAEATELEDLEPTNYRYEIDPQRQDESTIMTVGQFRKLIREVGMSDLPSTIEHAATQLHRVEAMVNALPASELKNKLINALNNAGFNPDTIRDIENKAHNANNDVLESKIEKAINKLIK